VAVLAFELDSANLVSQSIGDYWLVTELSKPINRIAGHIGSEPNNVSLADNSSEKGL
jgi:hypothetical protein